MSIKGRKQLEQNMMHFAANIFDHLYLTSWCWGETFSKLCYIWARTILFIVFYFIDKILYFLVIFLLITKAITKPVSRVLDTHNQSSDQIISSTLIVAAIKYIPLKCFSTWNCWTLWQMSHAWVIINTEWRVNIHVS